MAHLGNRVTALVDDALDERERCSVQAHLLTCEPCRDAVRRERHLKSRMTCGRVAPAPPAALVAALADRRVLAEHVARQERRRLAGLHAAVTVGGLCASLTVLGLLAGGSSPVRQQLTGVVRGPQPVSTVVQATSEPGGRGGMMGARNGYATRSQVPTMLSPAPVTVPMSVVGRPLL
jgi:hypothetical protein